MPIVPGDERNPQGIERSLAIHGPPGCDIVEPLLNFGAQAILKLPGRLAAVLMLHHAAHNIRFRGWRQIGPLAMSDMGVPLRHRGPVVLAATSAPHRHAPAFVVSIGQGGEAGA